MATTVYATYIGKGRFEVRASNYISALDEKLSVGGYVKLTCTRPRSLKQLAFFFVWLREVFDNLPEDCPHPFRDSEHLRAWLLYRTGNARCFQVPRDELGSFVRVCRQISSGHVFWEMTDTAAYMFVPQSISIEAMDAEQFRKFFNEAQELAQELIPGLDVKALSKRAQEQSE